jgi:hypothetical protein
LYQEKGLTENSVEDSDEDLDVNEKAQRVIITKIQEKDKMQVNGQKLERIRKEISIKQQ